MREHREWLYPLSSSADTHKWDLTIASRCCLCSKDQTFFHECVNCISGTYIIVLSLNWGIRVEEIDYCGHLIEWQLLLSENYTHFEKLVRSETPRLELPNMRDILLCDRQWTSQECKTDYRWNAEETPRKCFQKIPDKRYHDNIDSNKMSVGQLHPR